jgi:hypothetical protein
MKQEKPLPGAAKPVYQPNPREKAALAREARRSAEAAPRIKVEKDAKASILSVDHPDNIVGFALLGEALGTYDIDFVAALLGQLASASSRGPDVDEKALNFLLSVVKSIKPRDQLEAMLAAQMGVIHTAIMTFGRKLAHVETLPQQDSAERALNKLSRTYATQMEALKRYRSSGEQKVTVQHVSVNEGGQAIVANVTSPPDTQQKRPEASPAALMSPKQSPMTIVDEPARVPVRLRRTQEK